MINNFPSFGKRFLRLLFFSIAIGETERKVKSEIPSDRVRHFRTKKNMNENARMAIAGRVDCISTYFMPRREPVDQDRFGAI